MLYLIIAFAVYIATGFYLVHRDIKKLREYIDSIALKEIDIKPNKENADISKSLRNERGFFSYKKYTS